MMPRFYTLWAVNAAFDEHELCRQLDQMRSYGFDGVVFHPRFYPNEPPYLGDAYLAILSRAILHAKATGLEFWIYDENGWPSGTVGGEMQRQHPNVLQQWADLVMEKPAACLAEFGVPPSGGPTEPPEGGTPNRKWYLARRTGSGVDYLNPDLARHFIAMTHERYRTGLAPEAFAHVSAFFCDEPEFGLGHAFDSLSPHGAIPWTPRLPELFRARYGEELEPLLPLLFFPGARSAEVRVKFWELLTDIFNQSFNAPLNEWCRAHGKRYTAHVKGEEHPLFQVPTSGSCHQVFQHIALPGIDALERFPSGHFFPRQVASVAQQFGNGECMVECFGGAGWGASPEDFENYLNWLAGHGLTHFVTHLWQYRLTTHAIQDWPPSHPAHVNWRAVYPLILDRVRRNFSAPRPPASTLVVAPYRGIMAGYDSRELLQTNIHNAATYPATVAGNLNTKFLQLLDRVHQSGANYHVADERTIQQHGKIVDGVLHVGQCAYPNVVLAEGVMFNGGVGLSNLGRRRGDESQTRPELKTPHVVSYESVAWHVRPGTINELVLEVQASSDGCFIARFEAAVALDAALWFADDVRDVRVNGEALGAARKFRCVAGQNELRFACDDSRVTPFVSVRGEFLVRSRAPFVDGPNGTQATDGAFVLEAAAQSLPAADLLAAGFPFCREAVTLLGEIELSAGATSLQLAEIRADCAHVSVGGVDCGWCWGADWRVTLPENISAGRHAINVRLVPSTFNFFGPHHHVDGDRHVVSPVQFQYLKNFADRADAPDCTRVNAWHFKPSGLGGKLTVGAEAVS